MAIRLLMALSLILVMTGLYFVFKEAGWQFAVGYAVGVGTLYIYARWKHGLWIGD